MLFFIVLFNKSFHNYKMKLLSNFCRVSNNILRCIKSI